MSEVIVRIVPKSADVKVSPWRLRRAVRFLKRAIVGVKRDSVSFNNVKVSANYDNDGRDSANVGVQGDNTLCDGTYVGTQGDNALFNGDNISANCGDVLHNYVNARDVDYRRYKHVEFIDCGANLETITCPNCGAMIDFSWWGKAMNKAYELHFKDMDVLAPCCNKKTTLGGLNYSAPCAFAKTEIRIFDARDLIPEETISAVEKICKTPLQAI